MSEIPQWAYERAIQLSGLKHLWTPEHARDCQNAHLNAFASYIAEASRRVTLALGRLSHHDNCTAPFDNLTTCSCGLSDAHNDLDRMTVPPVDPIRDALRETFGAAAPEFVAAFKAAIAKRGLVIVEPAHV